MMKGASPFAGSLQPASAGFADVAGAFMPRRARPFEAINLSKANPLVKICGLRSVDAALAATAAGADFLGFNFAPVSKRRVDPGVAAEAIAASRSAGDTLGDAAMVGIFVNQPADEVAALAASCRLDCVQLSGSEDATYCAEVAARTGLPVIKAIRLGVPDEAAQVERYTGDAAVDLLLADAAVAGSWGGSGAAWDWSAAAGVAARFPLLLAGGLTVHNVGAAIAAVRPLGVDVASGVETDGLTDPDKIRAFIQTVKRIPNVPLSPQWERGPGGEVLKERTPWPSLPRPSRSPPSLHPPARACSPAYSPAATCTSATISARSSAG
jgi:phosphoribosylanthranilate isomerase